MVLLGGKIKQCDIKVVYKNPGVLSSYRLYTRLIREESLLELISCVVKDVDYHSDGMRYHFVGNFNAGIMICGM